MQGEKEVLHFQTTRLVKALFKNYLNEVANLQDAHNQMMEKISYIIPENEVNKLDLVDYFDEAKYNFLRKRILDLGNDALREIESILEMYEITLKR